MQGGRDSLKGSSVCGGRGGAGGSGGGGEQDWATSEVRGMGTGLGQEETDYYMFVLQLLSLPWDIWENGQGVIEEFKLSGLSVSVCAELPVLWAALQE